VSGEVSCANLNLSEGEVHLGGNVRVLMDACIMKPRPTGIQHYARAMIAALAPLPKIDLVVVGNDPEALAPGFLTDAEFERVLVSPRTRDFMVRQMWRERSLPRLVTEHNIDVVLVPAPEMTLRPQHVPTVAVVHDVGPLVRPEMYGRGKRLRFRLLPAMMKRASTIVCVSEATATDLRPFLGSTYPPLRVIGEGTGFLWRKRFASVDRPQRTGPPFDPPSAKSPSLVLYTGSAEAHKNLPTLVRAFAAIDDARLVLIGPGTERYASAPNVDARGWVEDRDLAAMLSRADIVVNPSLYEGFGLPALEALSSGIPAVLSAIPAFVEVAGSAAEFVPEPESPAAWTEKIVSLLRDPLRRAELAAAGVQRAEQWTWDNAARQMEAVLLSLVEGKDPPQMGGPGVIGSIATGDGTIPSNRRRSPRLGAGGRSSFRIVNPAGR
jgi:glycosyltransferase involved in cell wall biosynthesis